MSGKRVDVQEIVNQFGLEMSAYPVGLVSLVNIEDLHPTQISENKIINLTSLSSCGRGLDRGGRNVGEPLEGELEGGGMLVNP